MTAWTALAFIAVTTIMSISGLLADRYNPVTLTTWMWVILGVVWGLDLLHLRPVGLRTSLLMLLGIGACLVPVLVRSGRSSVPNVLRTPSLPRFILASFTVLGASALGVLAFRDAISNVAGDSTEALTDSQIRAIQISGSVDAGFSGLLAALFPLLVCLGLYGAIHFSKWFLLLSVFGVVASIQTPARLMTMVLGVVAAVFYIYAGGRGFLRRLSRARIFLGAVLVTGFLVVFFDLWGQKRQYPDPADAYLTQTGFPKPIASLMLYFAGGGPAFDFATSYSLKPFDFGSSTYVFQRLGASLGLISEPPQTIGAFVPIPVEFNLYTGFGNMWSDYGWLGIVLLSLALGAVTTVAHRRSSRGTSWIWTAAICSSLLVSMPMSFRLFNLDTAFQLMAGWLIFEWIEPHVRLDSRGRGRRPHKVAHPKHLLRGAEEGAGPDDPQRQIPWPSSRLEPKSRFGESSGAAN